jgi:hypothetical protein
MAVFEVLTYVGAAFGFLFLLLGLTTSTGAPQEAAAAAMACAFVIIPYCVTSALQRAEMLRRTGTHDFVNRDTFHSPSSASAPSGAVEPAGGEHWQR